MKKILLVLAVVLMTIFFTGCSENYSNGERIGLITQFSKSGLVFKTWEGHLNMTQTGMNSSQAFDFSIDRDNESENVAILIDSAAKAGWKVKLVYRETFGWNWFNNRGETSHFIEKVEILDRTPMASIFGNKQAPENVSGKVIDTIYVVIDKSRN